MKLEIFQVDAFTSKVFGGNPAAVCFMDSWLPDAVMQKIALENNLPETAFFVPSQKEGYDYHLRWFTPAVEMDLCGHATLATAYCLFDHLGFGGSEIRFESRSGLLTVTKSAQGFTLDFPKWDYSMVEDVSGLEDILGLKVQSAFKSKKICAVVDSPETIKNFVPDIGKIKTLTDVQGLVITAKGKGETDFASRFFAPQIGIDEDPVTGAIHCMLTPYWGGILGKTKMNAEQLSVRGGKLLCEIKPGNRIHITGEAVLYMRGNIFI